MKKEKEVDSTRTKTLDDTIASLEKAYGKGTIMILGDSPIQKPEVISTGCLSLDYALGVGGVPKGRIIEIYGPQSGGKTTMSLHIIAECQKAGGTAAFVDAEHALSLELAHNVGVDVSKLMISQPDYGEQALEIVESLVKTNAVDIIVVDSVAALTPLAEIEGDMGQAHMALQARLMSQALRKLTAVTDKAKTCLIFINQLRDKVGIMFGSPEETPGGKALKFYSSVRLDVRRMAAIKNGQNIIGNRTKIKVVKNKVAPPFREVEVDIIFGKGIDIVGDVIDLAVQFDIIKKGGAWYTYMEDRFQGSDQISEYFKREPAAFGNLKLRVKEVLDDKKSITITKEELPE